MRYFITTPEWAQNRSREEALSRGCGPVTAYWWAWIINHSDSSQAALQFGDNEQVPPDCEPTVDTLPPEWFEGGTAERAIAEERERAS